MKFDIILRGPTRRWEFRNVPSLEVLGEVADALFRGDVVTVGRSEDVRVEFPMCRAPELPPSGGRANADEGTRE